MTAATIPPYGLRPYRELRCTRCPRVVEAPCGCPPWVGEDPGMWAAGQEFGGRGSAALHESATCSPQIPARCPSCKAEGWLTPPRWEPGKGQHPRSIARRRAARAATKSRP